MTQGPLPTGTYAINGTPLSLQPTSGRWLAQDEIGITGDGHSIYPALREFELRWQLEGPSDHSQLVNFFNAIQITGTMVVDLPKYGASSYFFFSYSGCVVQQPELGQYYEQYINDVVLVVRNIQT
jgi:hypothetical protein